MAADLELFRAINGLAGQWPLLDALMRLVVNDYFVPTTMSLALLALWFIGDTPEDREAKQRAVIYAVLTLLLANLVVKLCNLVYYRPRPFESHEVNLLFYRPWDSSFPSNPAAIGFAFASAIGLRQRRCGWALGLLAALFGFSRIYCGVQYPVDVLAGALIGMAAGWATHAGRRWLDPLADAAIALGRRLYLA